MSVKPSDDSRTMQLSRLTHSLWRGEALQLSLGHLPCFSIDTADSFWVRTHTKHASIRPATLRRQGMDKLLWEPPQRIVAGAPWMVAQGPASKYLAWLDEYKSFSQQDIAALQPWDSSGLSHSKWGSHGYPNDPHLGRPDGSQKWLDPNQCLPAVLVVPSLLNLVLSLYWDLGEVIVSALGIVFVSDWIFHLDGSLQGPGGVSCDIDVVEFLYCGAPAQTPREWMLTELVNELWGSDEYTTTRSPASANFVLCSCDSV